MSEDLQAVKSKWKNEIIDSILKTTQQTLVHVYSFYVDSFIV